MTKTVILGSEYDQELRRAVVEALKKQGAFTISQDYGVGGSQELETLEIELDGQRLVLESETYIGLSLTGDDTVVDRIVSLLGLATKPAPS